MSPRVQTTGRPDTVQARSQCANGVIGTAPAAFARLAITASLATTDKWRYRAGGEAVWRPRCAPPAPSAGYAGLLSCETRRVGAPSAWPRSSAGHRPIGRLITVKIMAQRRSTAPINGAAQIKTRPNSGARERGRLGTEPITAVKQHGVNYLCRCGSAESTFIRPGSASAVRPRPDAKYHSSSARRAAERPASHGAVSGGRRATPGRDGSSRRDAHGRPRRVSGQ